MIEMVYRGTSKDGKGKERTGLPKNIRQIGDAGSDKRVYIEDYVITFLEKTGCAVLLGEVWQNENMKCLFADGAVEIAEGEPNDDMWEKIYREMKQYFPGREVIGWAKRWRIRKKNRMRSSLICTGNSFRVRTGCCFCMTAKKMPAFS